MLRLKTASGVIQVHQPNSRLVSGKRSATARGIASAWQRWVILLSLELMWACSPSVKFAPEPSFTLAPQIETPSAITPGFSPDGPGCYYVWSTNELPDLGKQFQSRLEAVFPAVQASAYAFGEDCRHPDGTTDFLAMETDFRVHLQVDSTSDEAALGDAMRRTMAVVEALPSTATVGPRLGRVEFQFDAVGMESVRLNVEIARYRAEARGLEGAVLFRHFHAAP